MKREKNESINIYWNLFSFGINPKRSSTRCIIIIKYYWNLASINICATLLDLSKYMDLSISLQLCFGTLNRKAICVSEKATSLANSPLYVQILNIGRCVSEQLKHNAIRIDRTMPSEKKNERRQFAIYVLWMTNHIKITSEIGYSHRHIRSYNAWRIWLKTHKNMVWFLRIVKIKTKSSF